MILTIYFSLMINLINGTSKNDVLIGTNGQDLIDGGRGSDYLFGGEGNDTIFGGDGNDFIVGTISSRKNKSEVDLLVGGGGADTFSAVGYDLSGSKDFARIADFSLSQKDKVGLRGGMMYTYASINGSTEIYSGDKDLIARLEGVQLGSGIIGGNSSPSWITLL